MNFQINSNYDYHEICEELGVSYESFLEFIRQNNGSEDNDIVKAITISIDEAVDSFLQDLKRRVESNRRSEETFITYTSFLKNYCRFLQDNFPTLNLYEINETHLDRYLKNSNSTSEYTSNTYTAILRSFLKYCWKNSLLSHDIRSRFEWLKEPHLPRYVPDPQLDSLLRASLQMINGYRNHAILSVLAGTGLRVSELSSLRIMDIKIEDKVIFVQKGKGRKERYVTLYPEVEQILLDYLNITGVKQLDPQHSGYVFTKDYGMVRKKQFTKNAIEKMFQRACKRANILDHYTPHSLRHTFAVRCVKVGMSDQYLCQLLGHDRIETTSIYTKLLPVDLSHTLTTNFPFPMQDLLFRSVGVD